MVPLTQSWWMHQCLSLLHYMVSHQVHSWNLLAKYFQKKKNPKVVASQLFYHIILPYVSSPSELIASWRTFKLLPWSFYEYCCLWFKHIQINLYNTIFNHTNIRIRTEARAYQVLLLYNILTKYRKQWLQICIIQIHGLKWYFHQSVCI